MDTYIAGVKVVAATVALLFVAAILGSAIYAIWAGSMATKDLLTLTQLILSWPVAAGGLVFGGAQSIARALK